MSNKLTPEELEKFQQYRVEASRLFSALADLTYRQTFLQFELDSIKESIRQNATNQQANTQEITSKYGNVSVNLEDGTLISLDAEVKQEGSELE
jgi:hypothetical protein